jgi:phage-related protein
MTDLAIRIATTMDATGLNKADKQVKSFEKSVKSLGRTLGLSLSAAAVVAFGKKAAQAFIQDEKEAQRLTTAVKNLGLELSAPAISQYIDNLSKISGVTDSQLRPAFQALLQTTGSVTASQQALQQAIDVSVGSGIELTTVSQDLANAYIGVTRGLRKYNLGLTQAELKTLRFSKAQELLNAQFGGSQAAYLATYAGKLQVLTEALGTASERIGGAIIDLALANRK